MGIHVLLLDLQLDGSVAGRPVRRLSTMEVRDGDAAFLGGASL
ncbi:hypothetical protein [Cellulomonas fimi]|nr:hypothetical protein [Cellulomonas fimi]